MSEEGETQAGFVPDPAEALVHDVGGLVDGVRTQVGQLSTLEVAPHLLHGIEVGGIAGEWFDDEPITLLGDELVHGLASMRGEPVPDEGDLLPYCPNTRSRR